jgi:hypothetical protein
MTSKYGVWDELPDELYIIGDIHGDFYALKQSLIKTGCVMFDETNINDIIKQRGNEILLIDGCDHYSINKNILWNPEKKNVFIVFVGDLTDRCRMVNDSACYSVVNDENCDYKILKLLLELDLEAEAYNSRVIIVLGNHEIMNFQEKFKYASIKALADINRKNNIINLLKINSDKLYGIVRINNYLICHGGINPDFIKTNSIYFNSTEFTGQYNIYIKNFLLNYENKDLINNVMGPLWDRTNGFNTASLNQSQCEDIFIKNILNIKNISELKIIVAHCPQIYNTPQNGINITSCGTFTNRIWRVDISMSRAFDNYIKDIPILNQLLDQLNYFIDYGLNPPDILLFYEFRKDFTAVQILKIFKNTNFVNEEILNGEKSLVFFYNDIFRNRIILKYLYLLQDLYSNFANLEYCTDELLEKIYKIKNKLGKKCFGSKVLSYDII